MADKPQVPTTTFIHKATGLKLRFMLAAFFITDKETSQHKKYEAEELLKKENEALLQTFLDDTILGLNGQPQKPRQRQLKGPDGSDPVLIQHYGVVEIIPDPAEDEPKKKSSGSKK